MKCLRAFVVHAFALWTMCGLSATFGYGVCAASNRLCASHHVSCDMACVPHAIMLPALSLWTLRLVACPAACPVAIRLECTVHGKPAPRYCFVLTTERAYVIMRHPVRLEVRTHIILSRGTTLVVWLTHPKPTYMHSMCALGPSAEFVFPDISPSVSDVEFCAVRPACYAQPITIPHDA